MNNIYSVLIVEINFFYLYISFLAATVIPIALLYLFHRNTPIKKLILLYLNYGILIFMATILIWSMVLSTDNCYTTTFTRPMPGSNLGLD